MRRRDISICLRPLAPIEEKRRNIRQKDLVTSEWVNSPVSRCRFRRILSAMPLVHPRRWKNG